MECNPLNICSYVVEWCNEGICTNTNTSNDEYTIEHLLYCTLYTISIVPFSESGPGPAVTIEAFTKIRCMHFVQVNLPNGPFYNNKFHQTYIMGASFALKFTEIIILENLLNTELSNSDQNVLAY